MWWMDLEPYAGPAWEPDWVVDLTTNTRSLFGNTRIWRISSGSRNRILPGEMFIVDGQPLGVVVSVDYEWGGPVSVHYQDQPNY